jgi:hypothetical protein
MTPYTNILLYLNFESTAFIVMLDYNVIVGYLVTVHTFDRLSAAIFLYFI